ncbi:MAG: hypothetical protein Rhims3KO_36690 [Hyphomicrobiales bacterium]
MSRFLNAVSRAGLSGMGNAALATLAGGVAACGVALTALYLMENIEATPATTELICLFGLGRPDCPDRMEEVAKLEGKLADLTARTRAAEGQLHSLRAVNDVNRVTFFQTFDPPSGGPEVTVGTVYSHLIGNPAPVYHYCYIDLPDGMVGEDRYLNIHNARGPIEVSASALRAAGVSESALAFARSICRPFVIGAS